VTASPSPRFGLARGAIFFDRDGTLIHDVEYIRDPAHVELTPYAASAIRLVNNSSSMPVVVVTNQSGIARGLLTVEDYERVKARIDDLLAERNAFIDASYYCPHHPSFTGACECRKPGVALFRQAAAELNLDLSHSVFIGDRWRDVEPAQAFGGRGILVPSPATPGEEVVRAAKEMEIAATLNVAVRAALGQSQHA
jgi:histidinol-phosphate phosphatase family protein